MKEFNPQGRNKEILDRAMEHIKSVPYRVSLRWLFYRLLQDGLYKTKGDYKGKWVGVSSQARKRSYGEWRPNTLRDDTSGMIERVGFFQDRNHVGENPDAVAKMIRITLDPFYELDRYTIIGFEARAMVEQFMYYTEGINLLPFGGDAHIEPKWDIAKHIEEAHGWYGGILTQFLYFGDSDDKGRKIPVAAMKDIRKWCKHPIEFVWCGLTEEQAEKFNLPENPEEPGHYQWEALADPQAREIISQALVHSGVDTQLIKAKVEEGEQITIETREKVRKLLSPNKRGRY